MKAASVSCRISMGQIRQHVARYRQKKRVIGRILVSIWFKNHGLQATKGGFVELGRRGVVGRKCDGFRLNVAR